MRSLEADLRKINSETQFVGETKYLIDMLSVNVQILKAELSELIPNYRVNENISDISKILVGDTNTKIKIGQLYGELNIPVNLETNVHIEIDSKLRAFINKHTNQVRIVKAAHSRALPKQGWFSFFAGRTRRRTRNNARKTRRRRRKRNRRCT